MFLWGAEFLKWNVAGFKAIPAEERFFSLSKETNRHLPHRHFADAAQAHGRRFSSVRPEGMLTASGLFQRRSEFPDVPVFDDIAKDQRPSGTPWQAYVIWAGSDSVGRPFHAAPKTPAESARLARQLRPHEGGRGIQG